MKHLTVKEKEREAFEKMKSIFHYKNALATPPDDKNCHQCRDWNDGEKR